MQNLFDHFIWINLDVILHRLLKAYVPFFYIILLTVKGIIKLLLIFFPIK